MAKATKRKPTKGKASIEVTALQLERRELAGRVRLEKKVQRLAKSLKSARIQSTVQLGSLRSWLEAELPKSREASDGN